MFKIILEEDLKVLTLSEINVAGNPWRLTNLRNIIKNDSSDIFEASSECAALVEVHVKTYVCLFLPNIIRALLVSVQWTRIVNTSVDEGWCV